MCAVRPDSPTAGARPSVALAAVEQGWAFDDDAPLLLDALESAGIDAAPAMWDDASVDWSTFDLVVIRSTWDYAERPHEFARWADRVEQATTLANPAAVVRWNLDKHYLADLARRGVPVVPTNFLEPGASRDEIAASVTAAETRRGGQVVVKPCVSAGSKDTVRHSAANATAAVDHAAALLAQGRSVMVQPYLDAVDELGETGMLFFAGSYSHAFRKAALLAPDGAPPEGLFAPERITDRHPAADELRLAAQVLAATREVIDDELLYARVDVLRDADGAPMLLELELVEPTEQGAPDRAARAIADAARASWSRRARH